jgi:hypothetical protein
MHKLALMVGFFVTVAHSASTVWAAKSLDWKALRDTWVTYEEKPTSEAESRLYRLLCDKPGCSQANAKEDDITIVTHRTKPLYRRIGQGVPSAIDLGFRAIQIADGAFAEELYGVLGDLIESRPEVFLRHYLKNRPFGDIGMCVNSMDEVADDQKALLAKLDKRLASLARVTDPGLSSARKDCELRITTFRRQVAKGR